MVHLGVLAHKAGSLDRPGIVAAYRASMLSPLTWQPHCQDAFLVRVVLKLDARDAFSVRNPSRPATRRWCRAARARGS